MPYSSLKIFHHREWIDAIKDGHNPAPIFVELIPTNRCNQNCNFCAYRAEGYSSNQDFNVKDQLSWDKLREIIKDCKSLGVKAVELTGGGEPMLHPDFLALCDLIVTNGMDLGIVTNGALWTEVHPIVLQHAKWIRFSLDAGTSTTYALIRKSTSRTYDKVRSAIQSIAGRGPLVGVGFVITHENWFEVEVAADAAFKDGANNFRISAVFQNGGAEYFKSFDIEAQAACKRIVEKYRDTPFKVFDLFSARLQDLSQGPPNYSFCGFQRATTYIGADSNVYRCCVLAYNSQGLLGSIKNQSFKTLWQSQKWDYDAKTCPRCMFNNKNATIAAALNTNPLHVNFI